MGLFDDRPRLLYIIAALHPVHAACLCTSCHNWARGKLGGKLSRQALLPPKGMESELDPSCNLTIRACSTPLLPPKETMQHCQWIIRTTLQNIRYLITGGRLIENQYLCRPSCIYDVGPSATYNLAFASPMTGHRLSLQLPEHRVKPHFFT